MRIEGRLMEEQRTIKMMRPMVPSRIFTLILGILCSLLATPAFAQIHSNVVVDLSKGLSVLTDTSLGVPSSTTDGNSFNLAGAPYLRSAGVSVARFPGNHGVADLYHWSTKTTTPYKGTDVGYIAPEATFPSFAQFAEKLGQAIIVVNYGTNQKGDGGGEPAEAAAWVAYANGDSGNALPLGKDAAGQDWQTVGYWATLRSQAPLPSDDGLNFLRIQHPRPFGFKLWQIGDEVYNNGFIGGEHVGNADLHGPAPAALKDFGKLKNDSKLSASAYAQNLIAFSKAMKAVDPTIQIGAALNNPPDPSLRTKTYWDSTGEHPDSLAWAAVQWGVGWNKDLLKGACASLDFATLEWSQSPMLPPDYKTLNEADLLANSKAQFNIIVTSMLNDYGSYCPKGHTLPLVFAPAGIVPWPKIERPEVKAIWIADFYATLIESRTLNISWNEMYGDSMLSADRKKIGPAFYGFQMLHVMAHAPGDALVDASSSNGLVGAHAAFRRDGYIAVMLVNKDPKVPAIVKLTYKNGGVGASGKRFEYGAAQYSTGAPMAVTPFTATGNEMEITIPPYTITDIVLPRQN
jgi:hypothetical protein